MIIGKSNKLFETMLKQQQGNYISKMHAAALSQPCSPQTQTSPSQLQHFRPELTKGKGFSKWVENEETDYCVLHNQERQIMCLTDKVRICPHCALFSTHRLHDLKTVGQMSELVKLQVEEWQMCNQRKAELDRKTSSPAFRQAMITKIANQKNKLVAEIKHKFKQLQENIKLAEKRAFDDVAKQFKTIVQRIAALDKQEHQSQLLYQRWNKTCLQVLQSTSFDQKAFMLTLGNLDVLKQGVRLVHRMEEKAQKKIETIEKIVSSIKVIENQGIANSLFNYLHISIQQQQEGSLQSKTATEETNLPKEPTEEEPELKKMNSAKTSTQPSSPARHCLKRGYSSIQSSQTRLPQLPSKVYNSRRSSQLVSPLQFQTVIAQFCSNDHLEILDLSNCYLLDSELHELLAFLKTKKKVKTLKLGKNKITNQGFAKILDLVPAVTSMNLSFNQLTEESLYELLRKRQKVPQLRIVNFSNNGLNQRKSQTVIEELKKQGLIVTI